MVPSPSKLKLAKVIPIFKKNDNKKFDNYRPISLLSSVSKIFERVVFNQLYNFFQEHNLLFESQYGFRKLHSTDLAALELIDRINKQIDQRKIPFSIFLDLSKAFGTLNHDILMKKLHYHVGLHIVTDFSISIPILIHFDTDINSIHIAIST